MNLLKEFKKVKEDSRSNSMKPRERPQRVRSDTQGWAGITKPSQDLKMSLRTELEMLKGSWAEMKMN